MFETPNRKVKAAQSLKKKLNKQNTPTPLHAWHRNGKEITVEELVDEYYKDPGKYFTVNRDNNNNDDDKSNGSSPPSSSGGGTATTAIVISRTFIELAKLPEIKNNKKEGVSDEYYLHAKNGGESQQILCS